MTMKEDPGFGEVSRMLRGWRGRRAWVQVESYSASSPVAMWEDVTIGRVEDVVEEDRWHPGEMIAVGLFDRAGEEVANLVISAELYQDASTTPASGSLEVHLAGVVVRIGMHVSSDEGSKTEPHTWTDQQRRHALDLLERQVWGEIDGAMRTLEEGLRLAMRATRDGFSRWERDAHEEGFADEFSLTDDQVSALEPEWRLAYVARLLRTIALMYGVETEFSDDPSLFPSLGHGGSGDYIAALLHGLNDISVGITP